MWYSKFRLTHYVNRDFEDGDRESHGSAVEPGSNRADMLKCPFYPDVRIERVLTKKKKKTSQTHGTQRRFPLKYIKNTF